MSTQSERSDSPQGWALLGGVIGGIGGFVLTPAGIIGGILTFASGGLGAFFAHVADYIYHVRRNKPNAAPDNTSTTHTDESPTGGENVESEREFSTNSGSLAAERVVTEQVERMSESSSTSQGELVDRLLDKGIVVSGEEHSIVASVDTYLHYAEQMAEINQTSDTVPGELPETAKFSEDEKD